MKSNKPSPFSTLQDLRGALKSTSQLEKHLLEEYKWRTRVGMNADSKSSELLDLPMQINQTLSESRDKSISNFNESFVDKFLNKFGSLMGSPGSSDFPYIIHDGKLFCRPEHFNYTRRKENRSEISHFGSDTFVEGDEDVNTFKYYNRIQPFEQMIALALQIGSRLQHFHPLLHHIVGEGSKIPLIFNGGDFCHCNGKKWPLFTFAKAASSATQLNCSAFTVPSSTAWAVHRTKLLPSFWNATQSSQNQKYPWMFKIPKAVWRGSTTGHKSDWHDLPRARLVQTSIEHPSIVDAGFSKILQKPAVHKSQILRESRLVPSIEFKDFMMYRAVIDIDGNSWSSRFGELLCMNSVVIKVRFLVAIRLRVG